eukprot:NODE_5419_length_313_cov_0.977273_g4807_i0.p1 GENE.NODE_5419_length_313_cov_0.977273_g4807_i0~~NODE_5419_length_313_cov_0.977273_g4807_i0.p1  ORF type:complete len:54 (+),score=0.37 NODE_5419_length_313_cov_0.977273_g4807_i0:144-305(+)
MLTGGLREHLGTPLSLLWALWGAKDCRERVTGWSLYPKDLLHWSKWTKVSQNA